MKTVRPVLSAHLALGAALLCLTSGCGHKTANNAPPSVPHFVTTGTMTESEYTRIGTLRNTAQTIPLTVSDVDWLLSVADRKSPSASLQGGKLARVAGVFADAGSTRLPTSRHDEVLAFATNEIKFWKAYQPTVVEGHLVTLENVPMSACLVLKVLGTEDALAQIRPLLTSPNADVREFAQEVLARKARVN